MDGWDWADYRQDRQIRELRGSLESVSTSLYEARSSTRRLQSELSKVTGSIELRINRLATAFDAFVELSNLRMTLGLFDAHARVRHRARALFGEHPLPGELSDVDGYWLAPALSAVQAGVDDQPWADALALANFRDARRATLFHVLATVLLGRPELASTAMAAEVLPELEPAVPMYQRALWLLAADGLLGADAPDLVLRRGIACLETVSDADRDGAVAAWLKAIRPERDVSLDLPTELAQAADLIGALDACERLSVLRHWVAAQFEEPEAKPADEVDPIVKRTLELLVDEGSPLELPLLSRERELRKVIESNGVAATGSGPDSWESPAGAVLELLRGDIEDEAHPGRRALAFRMSAEHIVAAGERLAERARQPLGDEVPLRTDKDVVTITKAGPVQRSLDRALARAVAARQITAQRRTVGYTAIGFGVALALLALLGWGWLVPAIGAFALGGWQLWRDREERTAVRELAASTRSRLRADADQGVMHYLEACDDLARRRDRIEDDLTALRASFTTVKG
jgi:hypothetical protein